METKKKVINMDEILSEEYKDALNEIRNAWKNTKYLIGAEKNNIEINNNDIIIDEEKEDNENIKNNTKESRKKRNKNTSNEKKNKKRKKKEK